MALTLGASLLVYEYRYDKKIDRQLKMERIRLAWAIIVVSIIAIAVYYLLYLAISSSYSGNPQLPLELRLAPFYNMQAEVADSLATSQPSVNWLSWQYIYLIYALAIVFLGFGITALLFPDITAVLALPWLAEGIVFANASFIYIWYQYYSFVVGSMLVAAILSLGILQARENLSKIISAAPAIIISFAIVLLLYSQAFSLSENILDPGAQYYFQPYPYQSQISKLDYVVAHVPNNASVITDYFIASHLTQRRYLDILGTSFNTTYWFMPQYILVDFNENISQNAFTGDQGLTFDAFLGSYNYTLILQNGSAKLYELNGQR